MTVISDTLPDDMTAWLGETIEATRSEGHQKLAVIGLNDYGETMIDVYHVSSASDMLKMAARLEEEAMIATVDAMVPPLDEEEDEEEED